MSWEINEESFTTETLQALKAEAAKKGLAPSFRIEGAELLALLDKAGLLVNEEGLVTGMKLSQPRYQRLGLHGRLTVQVKEGEVPEFTYSVTVGELGDKCLNLFCIGGPMLEEYWTEVVQFLPKNQPIETNIVRNPLQGYLTSREELVKVLKELVGEEYS